MTPIRVTTAAFCAVLALSQPSFAELICTEAGPQTPRDITNTAGTNMADFAFAPAPEAMNLCNIHTHTNAEHKGPGFSMFVNNSAHGGYACNETEDLTATELDPSADGDVKAGNTIEVHWVFTTCEPGDPPGLGACLCDMDDLAVRVETQVFLVVNDDSALDFASFGRNMEAGDGVHQPKALPTGTGTPVKFRGSTTGPDYDNFICSPFGVTWSVRPQCAKVSAASVNAWLEDADNFYKEHHSHGVRKLVTRPAYLSPISTGH